jgi:hypothetical protein
MTSELSVKEWNGLVRLQPSTTTTTTTTTTTPTLTNVISTANGSDYEVRLFVVMRTNEMK